MVELKSKKFWLFGVIVNIDLIPYIENFSYLSLIEKGSSIEMVVLKVIGTIIIDEYIFFLTFPVKLNKKERGNLALR